MADISLALRERLKAATAAFVDGQRGILLATVAFGWLLALGVRLVFPAVLPEIRSDFGMGLSTAGTLLSALWIAYAAMQFPGGLLADWIGERAILVVSVGVATVGVGGVVAAPTIESFFAATVLVGLGVGLYGTTRITVLSDTFPDHSGTAIGITQAAGNVGTTLLPPLAGLLTVWAGWRLSFGVLVPAFLLVIAGLWLRVPPRTSPRGADDTVVRISAVAGTLSKRRVVAATLMMAALSVVYQAFTGFYPTYLGLQKNLGADRAATLLGVFFGAAILIQPLAGAIGDRFGARKTLLAAVTMTGGGLAVIPHIEGWLPLVTVTMLASVQLSIWPIANAYVVEVVPDDIQGTTMGVTRTFYLGVGAVGPAVVFAVADAGRPDAGVFGLAALALVATVPALFLAAPDGA